MTMVDSREDEPVADPIDRLTERVIAVESRLDTLAGTVSALGGTVAVLTGTVSALAGTVSELSLSTDRRFDAVDVAFREQREYTEFAFERLHTEMNERFAAVDK